MLDMRVEVQLDNAAKRRCERLTPFQMKRREASTKWKREAKGFVEGGMRGRSVRWGEGLFGQPTGGCRR